jgi:hypothetical protein
VPVFEYVHIIEGRIRIKVPEVKRSVAFARRVEAMFREVPGIEEVRANPITGNVLFLHDPDRIAAREILAALIAAGYMGMGIDSRGARSETAGDLAATMVEQVCWGLVQALSRFTGGQVWMEWIIEAGARFLLKLVFGRVSASPA